ncbi:MAG: AAA family ATPase [Bacteroidales bacterium]|nr:AAA family ATPase [Bacteroidales bacterium]
MDKRLILAVAGSGKTTYLVNQIDLTRRFLIVTYTNNNVNNIRNAIIRKLGYFPNNIKLKSYFQFLISFCFNPFVKDKCKANGIYYKQPPKSTNYFKRDNIAFYKTRSGFLYHNRIAKLCQEAQLTQLISERLDKYFDCFFFDEIQDLAGHDFDLISKIVPKNAQTIFVGDFYQHTFDTSRDGNQNNSLHNDINKYCKKWQKAGMQIDTSTLSNSWRCTQTTCDYVRNNLGIEIHSQKSDDSTILFIDKQENLDTLIHQHNVPMLFLQEHSKYSCFSMNWGESKGLDDFIDIGIVLNKKTLAFYQENKLSQLAPSTKNKLYVALTRAKRNIYLIPYVFLENYKSK